MAIYAIGDIQGCYREFRELIDQCGFDPSNDRLWLVGDLVNRGPASLETLRFVRSLGDAAVSVLGNHDLYLLKIAYAGASGRKRHDTLQQVLEAPDRDELIAWLRTLPLMHLEGDYAMVHAGLLPGWTAERARALAREVEAALSGESCEAFLQHMWGNSPKAWSDDLAGWERLRVIVNAMTRMRFCTPDGRMEFDAKGPPDSALPNHLPWFAHPNRASSDTTIVCGHWSALGLRREPNLLALDSGCVWGEKLTAVRLEDRQVFQVHAGKRLGSF
ncbi:symmetrical bis(5'-nucleosyl)-tetraphosphatase [Aromatoleum buckelii]|uniref:Bis(5'-nucleosyl)-tetraphosphatase, symmetrical n=1 Tax=Aromatoleum buckelii TaxID=200254 RepID=A0ABX1N4A6_9RHOO|nr:symmetrical bis(5'-nucleosyl)-tetraphosphatase [Aromatoleum buckelii]MCK0511874.1 symmetrical bis(5'-nucleosyl)-tetraphosphatase [Aromatoleum buckelii]